MTVKVAVLGGSGHIGSAVVKELSSRGKYEVIAISRHPESIPSGPNVKAERGDVTIPADIIPKIKGVDVLVSALHFDVPASTIVEEAKGAGVKRLIVVGGAGTLHTSENGPLFLESPGFPKEFLPISKQGLQFYLDLKKATDLNWTFFAPPALIGPGEKRGTYRTGTDVLITDAEGGSSISYDDYALALVDEIENQKFKTRFTVAY